MSEADLTWRRGRSSAKQTAWWRKRQAGGGERRAKGEEREREGVHAWPPDEMWLPAEVQQTALQGVGGTRRETSTVTVIAHCC